MCAVVSRYGAVGGVERVAPQGNPSVGVIKCAGATSKTDNMTCNVNSIKIFKTKTNEG